ncbi:MAG TPA: carboxypeptidase-like regulatory domain-containing protein [Thermoanaerobaculia bacterium]|nr:carboxypeptidase-like regulatory domain-containing protein [Thermoanaerobaculia bacterium]
MRLFFVMLCAAFLACGSPERDPASLSHQPALQRPALYRSEAIHARVVDFDTGAPIEGAVVFARWSRLDAFTRRPVTAFHYYEAITDANGAFTIPAWGPRPLDYSHALDARDPELWVLKRGYLLGYYDNVNSIEPRAFASDAVFEFIGKTSPGTQRPENAGSIWNGRELRIGKGTPEMLDRSRRAAEWIQRAEIVKIHPKRWSEELRLY